MPKEPQMVKVPPLEAALADWEGEGGRVSPLSRDSDGTRDPFEQAGATFRPDGVRRHPGLSWPSFAEAARERVLDEERPAGQRMSHAEVDRLWRSSLAVERQRRRMGRAEAGELWRSSLTVERRFLLRVCDGLRQLLQVGEVSPEQPPTSVSVGHERLHSEANTE